MDLFAVASILAAIAVVVVAQWRRVSFVPGLSFVFALIIGLTIFAMVAKAHGVWHTVSEDAGTATSLAFALPLLLTLLSRSKLLDFEREDREILERTVTAGSRPVAQSNDEDDKGL